MCCFDLFVNPPSNFIFLLLDLFFDTTRDHLKQRVFSILSLFLLCLFIILSVPVYESFANNTCTHLYYIPQIIRKHVFLACSFTLTQRIDWLFFLLYIIDPFLNSKKMFGNKTKFPCKIPCICTCNVGYFFKIKKFGFIMSQELILLYWSSYEYSYIQIGQCVLFCKLMNMHF